MNTEQQLANTDQLVVIDGYLTDLETGEAFMVPLMTPEQKDAATVDAALTEGAPFRVDEDREVFTVKSEVNL